MSDNLSFESVYDWPEFRAFAKRLGIPMELKHEKITIRMGRGCLTVVEHEYVADDLGAVNMHDEE